MDQEASLNEYRRQSITTAHVNLDALQYAYTLEYPNRNSGGSSTGGSVDLSNYYTKGEIDDLLKKSSSEANYAFEGYISEDGKHIYSSQEYATQNDGTTGLLTDTQGNSIDQKTSVLFVNNADNGIYIWDGDSYKSLNASCLVWQKDSNGKYVVKNDSGKVIAELNNDGTLKLIVEDEMMSANDLLAQLAHETYEG